MVDKFRETRVRSKSLLEAQAKIYAALYQLHQAPAPPPKTQVTQLVHLRGIKLNVNLLARIFKTTKVLFRTTTLLNRQQTRLAPVPTYKLALLPKP